MPVSKNVVFWHGHLKTIGAQLSTFNDITTVAADRVKIIGALKECGESLAVICRDLKAKIREKNHEEQKLEAGQKDVLAKIDQRIAKMTLGLLEIKQLDPASKGSYHNWKDYGARYAKLASELSDDLGFILHASFSLQLPPKAASILENAQKTAFSLMSLNQNEEANTLVGGESPMVLHGDLKDAIKDYRLQLKGELERNIISYGTLIGREVKKLQWPDNGDLPDISITQPSLPRDAEAKDLPQVKALKEDINSTKNKYQLINSLQNDINTILYRETTPLYALNALAILQAKLENENTRTQLLKPQASASSIFQTTNTIFGGSWLPNLGFNKSYDQIFLEKADAIFNRVPSLGLGETAVVVSQKERSGPEL